jgi:hypothetical protein
MHRRGLFGVSVITSTFIRMVNTEARSFGIPDMPVVETPHHAGAVSHADARLDAEMITPVVVAKITGEGDGASPMEVPR